MKFKIVLILAALLIVSCGKLGDKAGSALDAISDLGTDDAGNVIAYNNALVDYYNEASDKMESANKDYAKMNDMVTKKQKARFFMGHAFIGLVPKIEKKRDGISLLKPGNNLPSEVKEDLTNSVKAASEAFENTHKAYKDFKEYLDNEDYKDDDWVKGKEYLDVVEKNIIVFYDNRAASYKLLKPIANAAEIKLMENHPLKESYIASKTDLALAEAIRDIVYAEEINIEMLNLKYDQLEGNYKKHKDLTPGLLKENNKDSYYKSFYEEIEEFLGDVRKNKRDGKITNNEAEDIGRGYQSLIKYYNRFV